MAQEITKEAREVGRRYKPKVTSRTRMDGWSQAKLPLPLLLVVVLMVALPLRLLLLWLSCKELELLC